MANPAAKGQIQPSAVRASRTAQSVVAEIDEAGVEDGLRSLPSIIIMALSFPPGRDS